MASHPTWVRGLKLAIPNSHITGIVSHPTWVRGLKHVMMRILRPLFSVAPYVGAWIETIPQPEFDALGFVAPYVGAWIETALDANKQTSALCRTLRGCVD